jgi:hypothetical protein
MAACQLVADIQDIQLTSSTSSGSVCDIPAGGNLLFEELFEDVDFASRGWYDGPAGVLSSEAAPGSTQSFQCDVAPGVDICAGGRPARRLFTPTSSIYLGFWLRLSDNWQGGIDVFTLLTNLEDDFKGPGRTKLTTSAAVENGTASLVLHDGENVDPNCVMLTDGSIVGCNGDFDSYAFTEQRSVASCNGLLGDVEDHECSSQDQIEWWSSRAWHGETLSDSAGPSYKADWHFVELYYEMNGFENDRGVANGKIRWLVDGVPIICSDSILFRTAVHSDMQFAQLLASMFTSGGTAEPQTMWIDDLRVATARP